MPIATGRPTWCESARHPSWWRIDTAISDQMIVFWGSRTLGGGGIRTNHNEFITLFGHNQRVRTT